MPKVVGPDEALSAAKYVKDYIEQQARLGDKNAENIYVGHIKTVVNFLLPLNNRVPN
jgi:hypothetical protein